jgi:hypothetical protein
VLRRPSKPANSHFLPRDIARSRGPAYPQKGGIREWRSGARGATRAADVPPSELSRAVWDFHVSAGVLDMHEMGDQYEKARERIDTRRPRVWELHITKCVA